MIRFVLFAVTLGLPCQALAGQTPSPPVTPDAVAVENDYLRLCLDANGRTTAFALRDGKPLLDYPAPFMAVQIGPAWHNAKTLVATREANAYRLRIGFEGTAATAEALLRVHSHYLEVEAVALAGVGAEAIDRWALVSLPVNRKQQLGGWLNVAWDDACAAAVIALDERTEAGGAPLLRAVGHRRLGFVGRKAAIIACPTGKMLETIHEIEQQHGIPSPTLGGQWNKTSLEARKSWMITGLTAAEQPAPFAAPRVLDTAKALGVEYVVISLGWWNTTLGRYSLNKGNFPQGIASLKAVAELAHAKGMKLGIHVMTGSISKEDPCVTPLPDPRLHKDGEVDLARDVDPKATEIPAVQSPASFGTASGYWAYKGTDVQIDNEIIRYTGLTEKPPALTGCQRGAYGTQAAAHKTGAKIRHLTERYGWYVADAALGADIGRSLAELINQAGLDMVCFDGADVTADPQTRFFDAHQVPLGIVRHARRDVLLVSNGTTHFGWHLMARGGEDDSMARGFQGWVDHHIVHAWGAYHRSNLVLSDFSWVGIFGHTPTMAALRPDDVELVCARSLGFDGAIGWGFAACFGGPSDVGTFSRNGRKDELAAVIRAYERLRLENYFPAGVRRPLCQLGSHWRLLTPANPADRYRLAPASFLRGPIVRPGAVETAVCEIRNDMPAQPLCVRIEVLPALAPYGASQNVAVADFAKLDFQAAGHPAAKASFRKTGQTHAQAGAVARLTCTGPEPNSPFPRRIAGHGQTCWAQAAAKFPAKLDLRGHRALGLWVQGDGGGEVLNVQLDIEFASCLHYYLPIDFTGWRYCELGEPEGDRVMDYYSYEKFALHDVPLDRFSGVTLMVLDPPRGRSVDLLIGRIEALRELGGEMVNPRITVGDKSLELPVCLGPEQYLETGDLWGTRDPAICRVFDPEGNQLQRLSLSGPLPTLPTGKSQIRFTSTGQPPARVKITAITIGR